MTWIDRLQGLLNREMLLTGTSAAVSTYGGGYFMCDYVHDAKRMAAAQLAIAVAQGSVGLAGRCFVHMAYSDIKLQAWTEALTQLRRAARCAVAAGDKVLLEMVVAARWTVRKLRAAGVCADAEQATRSDFTRVVAVRAKRHRAAGSGVGHC